MFQRSHPRRTSGRGTSMRDAPRDEPGSAPQRGRQATLRRPRRSPAEWWRRRRRWLIAGLVFVAVFAGLRAVAPADAGARLVSAPRADLSAGHVLSAEDLIQVRLSGPSSPEEGHERELVGRTLAVPWPAGVPLHRSALAGSGLTKGLEPGRVAVGLALGKGNPAGFVRPGDVVEVIVTDASEERSAPSRSVVSGARVLWAGGAEQAGGWLGSSAQSGQGVVVVVSVPRSAAAAVSGAPQRGAVSLVVTG
ncbi:RcpC/CpaB family pilus assembly protein [Galactobacter caseinivorans]|nr:RcpC/CpaB family pilus assembly protein [Galactobacter caseinivorans]